MMTSRHLDIRARELKRPSFLLYNRLERVRKCLCCKPCDTLTPPFYYRSGAFIFSANNLMEFQVLMMYYMIVASHKSRSQEDDTKSLALPLNIRPRLLIISSPGLLVPLPSRKRTSFLILIFDDSIVVCTLGCFIQSPHSLWSVNTAALADYNFPCPPSSFVRITALVSLFEHRKTDQSDLLPIQVSKFFSDTTDRLL